MDAKRTDISQIRKYLNGELDNLAMHQLEREAQDDPFLMDAIEGYQQTNAPQQSNLDELDERLQGRIGQSKVRKLISWKYYAAAASVLIVFTLGYLLKPSVQPVKEPNIALQKPTAPADHVVVKTDTALPAPTDKNLVAASIPKPKARANFSTAKAATDANAITPDAVTDDSEKASYGYNTPASNKVNSNAMVNTSPSPVSNNALSNNTVSNTSPLPVSNNALSNNAVSNTSTPNTNSNNYSKDKDSLMLKEITINGRAALAKTTSGYNSQTLQGKVEGAKVVTQDREKKASGQVLSELGLPLTGVTVQVDGKAIMTRTDANGYFSIPAKEGETLDIGTIGYARQQVKAGRNDSMKVSLQPNSTSLAEVVMVGYGKVKKRSKEAQPRMGWDGYTKYLKSKAITIGQTGTVRLSFTVDEKGGLSNFQVLKSVNDAINKQAIDLVKAGPAWYGDLSGQPKTVKLKVVFRKE